MDIFKFYNTFLLNVSSKDSENPPYKEPELIIQQTTNGTFTFLYP